MIKTKRKILKEHYRYLCIMVLKKYCYFNDNNDTTINTSFEASTLDDVFNHIQVAIDEVGRGSWAGRVYTAAVIWNPTLCVDEYPLIANIKDSKKLSRSQREKLYDFITENCIDYAINYKEAHEIDEINVLQATMASMRDNLDSLRVKFDNIIVDGNYFCGYNDIPYKCIVKGDNKYIGIACASILAKVAHDRHMMEISQEYPLYDWQNNMGYCSATHIEALKIYGATKYHRMSFNPMKCGFPTP